MSDKSDNQENLKFRRDKVIGLGEKSVRKNYYPQLQSRIQDLEQTNRLLNQQIAERKTIEAELRISEERFRNLTENTTDLVWEIDSDFCYSYVSPKVLELLGYTANEVVGQSFFNLFNIENSDSRESGYFKDSFEQFKPFSGFERSLTHKDGRIITLESSAIPILDSNNRLSGYRGIDRDITEKKKNLATRKSLEDQLQRSQKLESLGTLAGGIAHDFNNILTPILGFAELAHLQLPADSKLKPGIEQIVLAAGRAKELVKQILDFSRPSQSEFINLNLSSIVKEALKLLRSTLPASIKIHFDIQSDAGIVLADPTKIHQVIMNLCTNAYHAMKEKGGELAISLRSVDIEAHDAKLIGVGLIAGSYVKIEVSDTGHGMNRQTVERIFDPYFTTKKPGEGTGLGLAVVHGIIKNHQGYINCYSEIHIGTSFHIYLPKSNSAGEHIQTTENIFIPRGTESIMIVDDEKQICDFMIQCLSELGYTATAFQTPQEALAAFQSAPESYDMVISDMTMPSLNGLQLSRFILERNPDLPIIICSGFSDLINDEKAKVLGIKKYLMKPIRRKDLAQTVRKFLDEKKV